jgi:thiamine-phosphate diphosphorylase
MNDDLPEYGYTLMLVTDRTRSRWPLPELVRLAVEGGVNAIQVREKDLSESELIDLTGQVIEAAGDKAWVVVNGSLSAAKALGIGVHLPERGPSVEEARLILGEDALVGRSVHSIHEAKVSEGVDYLIAGPVYPTKSKPRVKPISIATFESIFNATSAPIYAIGGITSGSISTLANAGAFGVAVIGAICEADDPRAAAAEIRRALDEMAEEIFGDI